MYHLILPFAACHSFAWSELIRGLPASSFCHLNQLLRTLRLVHTDTGEATSLTPPHERALGRAYGLPTIDGLVPWAAWQHQQEGGQPGQDGWAYIHPCHWAMEQGLARMLDPDALNLSAADSQLLLTAMQPYFATHGITLRYQYATRWLAQGELLRELPSASLDRVIGQDVNPWLPAGPLGRSLRLLQNEMQMLLYTHPLNAERQARGLLVVNSFWLSGSGALPMPVPLAPTPVHTPHELAQAVFKGSDADYAQAWATLNAGAAAALWQAHRSGEPVQLTLCGERNALTFASAPSSLGQRVFSKIRNVFSPQPLPELLFSL